MTEATYYQRAAETIRERYDKAGESRREGCLEQAIEALQGIVRDEPGFAPAYNKLGVVEIARGAREPAREWFKEALRRDEDYAPALTNLGNLALEQQDYETAQLYYDRALAADEDFGAAHQNLAIVLQHQKRYADAVRHLRAARRRRRMSTGRTRTTNAGATRRSRALLVGITLIALAALLFVAARL